MICLIYTSCVYDKDDYKLKLINNSENKYYFIVKPNSLLKLNDVNYITTKYKFHYIKPNDTCRPLFARINEGGYARKINETCKDSTLQIYLFLADSVDRYGWSNIIKDEHHFIKKGFKVKYLDSINWFVGINTILENK